ncbi:MAG: ATP-binding cassette domain-containing protein [Magnetococcales bacterium]|nr:ATP-binding cassette domain-containing protein [Magnetococcales bacterium]
MSSTLLSVRDLTLHFGGVVALNRVSLDVASGCITSLIGPNGAGKTTLFNCITGFYRADHGAVLLRQQGHPAINLGQLSGGWYGGSHRVAKAGVARTFQNVRLFRDMTVLENLLVAQHRHFRRLFWAGLLQTARYREAERQALQRAMQWLHRFGLAEQANQLAGALPYGQQRGLEIARALCTQPQLLCLDEPAAGLNPSETVALSQIIRQLCQERVATILLIEHDMRLVMGISDHIVVLDHGEVIASGPPDQVRRDERVLQAYLGVTP